MVSRSEKRCPVLISPDIPNCTGEKKSGATAGAIEGRPTHGKNKLLQATITTRCGQLLQETVTIKCSQSGHSYGVVLQICHCITSDIWYVVNLQRYCVNKMLLTS